MEARRVSEAPTIKANFAPGILQRSVSLPDIWRPPTREYFTHDKQDTRPGLSSLPVNSLNSHGRNGGNTKSCTSVFKDEIVPLTEKEIENLTISALKDELGKRKLSKKGNKQILVSRLKSSLQSISQKTSAVSDQTDIPPLCTVRDEISYPENCPCLPLLLDLQKEVKEMKANSSRQIQPNLSSNCELTKLQEENNALKLRLRDVEDCYDSLKREARSIQDENKSLMTALRLLNNEFVNETKYRNGKNEDFKEQNLHEEENPWETVRDNKTMPRNKRRERQMPNGKKMSGGKSTGIASQKTNDDRTTVIVGDSIIKNVQGIKLAKAVGHRVVVKPFPGATIRDMRSHVVPTIEKKPDQICPHVGTNDLKSSTPNDVADAIIELAREVEVASESEIVLSELIARNDDYSDAVKAVNKRLKQLCKQNNWKLITSNGLNKGGLHLNREGNELLQKNFVNFLRCN
ncbi:uncharacterized protein [Montipora capricornis]|uniref:uncharacterized protein n=1 Tax=Montipora capricornis TaxID=246305 RepID=UPI0035F19665